MASKSLRMEISYRAMAKQAEAHGLQAKYRSFCGGWGNGKTSWGCAETFIRLHEFPGTTCIVARKTRPELRTTTWDMLMNGDPGAATAWTGIPVESIKSYVRSDLFVEFKNGSKIYGIPLDDPKKIENYNLGFFWIDQAEEIEEDLFLKFQGRLRQQNAPREGILTWNPSGHGWLWRRFIDANRPEKWKQLYQAVEARTWDNPNLPEDYLDQFEGLPEAWIQRFVEGSHEVFVGQIFTDWNPEVHVVQPFHIPPEWERWVCIDPGIRHESALSWMTRDPFGNKYYYRELLKSDQPVSWWAARMREIHDRADWGGPGEFVDHVLIGPESQQRAQTDGKSVLDLWNLEGVYPDMSDRDPAARISIITKHLRPAINHRNPFTGDSPSPQIFVFADCAKLIEYLPQYRWLPVRPNVAEQDSPERPRKKDDHNIDNLGHILLDMEQKPIQENEARPRKTEEQMLMEQAWNEAYEGSAEHDMDIHPILGRNW